MTRSVAQAICNSGNSCCNCPSHAMTPIGRFSDGIIMGDHQDCQSVVLIRFVRSFRMSSPVSVSRLPVGSSSYRRVGSVIKARAMAARCISPPPFPWVCESLDAVGQLDRALLRLYVLLVQEKFHALFPIIVGASTFSIAESSGRR